MYIQNRLFLYYNINFKGKLTVVLNSVKYTYYSPILDKCPAVFNIIKLVKHLPINQKLLQSTVITYENQLNWIFL